MITRIVSNRYTIYVDDHFEIAVAMGKLRLGLKPIVGDRVQVVEVDGKWRIEKILDRKNQLIRPLVANIDQVLVVMSAKEPDFSYTLVDRLIFLISLEGIEPVIVISKADMVEPSEIQEIVDEYENSGYRVIVTGSDLKIDALTEHLEGKLSVLAGQSGVGKSSLVNRIDEDLDLATQQISKALGRGRHTTRHNQLYPLGGGWIADTPGFSSLDFTQVDVLTLAQSVPDFARLNTACRYRDCVHLKEPGCAIKEAVENKQVSERRYQNYVDVMKLIKEDNRR